LPHPVGSLIMGILSGPSAKGKQWIWASTSHHTLPTCKDLRSELSQFLIHCLTKKCYL